jgi:hypothetical protein
MPGKSKQSTGNMDGGLYIWKYSIYKKNSLSLVRGFILALYRFLCFPSVDRAMDLRTLFLFAIFQHLTLAAPTAALEDDRSSVFLGKRLNNGLGKTPALGWNSWV